eukprot:GHVU01060302.1.p1 GENE.GHVU01060302.1~~GHVU01060302.1.p1  ORF type:complete len:217 (+),score=23.54 GHVU01060302.1:253-903(+)
MLSLKVKKRAHEPSCPMFSVLRLILQYLKENNLMRSFHALQEESSVTLNCVDSTEKFSSDIHSGKWDNVIQTVSHITAPEEVLQDLYEQVRALLSTAGGLLVSCPMATHHRIHVSLPFPSASTCLPLLHRFIHMSIPVASHTPRVFQMILEFLELKEPELCRQMLEQTAALQLLKLNDRPRYDRLKQLCNKQFIDENELYRGRPKEERRQTIAGSK